MDKSVMKPEKNYAISLLRFVAMVCIVLCHFFQYYRLELTNWFNVGVHVFFCISGYLYGQKRITSPVDFVGKNVKKILIPYYCFLIPVMVLYAVFHRELLGFLTVVGAFLTNGTLPGLGHFWFISYILFCYLITPALQALAEKMKKLKWQAALCMFGAGMLAAFVFFYAFNSFFLFSKVCGYVFGYFGAVFLQNYKKRIFTIGMCVVALLTVAANGIRVWFRYIAPCSIPFFDVFTDYAQALLGISLTFGVLLLARKVKGNAFLDLSDRYAFYVYIVHQLFIMSPFSLLTATGCPPLNWVITVLATVLAAMLLKVVAGYVEKGYSAASEGIKAKIRLS